MFGARSGTGCVVGGRGRGVVGVGRALRGGECRRALFVGHGASRAAPCCWGACLRVAMSESRTGSCTKRGLRATRGPRPRRPAGGACRAPCRTRIEGDSPSDPSGAGRTEKEWCFWLGAVWLRMPVSQPMVCQFIACGSAARVLAAGMTPGMTLGRACGWLAGRVGWSPNI